MMSKKQAVTGFKIVNYTVKSSKDSDKIRLVLEADLENINVDMGLFQGALVHHKVSDTELGLSVFVDGDIEFEE